jgi:peptidoglycan/xylan/chitin deacetylase (PgdA/CDA1 family)
MSRFIRDFFILSMSLLGVTLLYRAREKKEGPLVRVLVFHDVRDGAWFRRTIEHLVRAHHVVSPRDFLTRTFDAHRVNILITFDDGYASWVDTCLPILKEHGVQVIFFVNSGLVSRKGDSEAQGRYVKEKLLLSPRETISWNGVRTLRDAGHTIGGHTVSHERLSTLSSDAQAREIRDDKATIERELGRPAVVFAYPFGNASDYTETTIQIVRDAPYGHAFTTEGTFIDHRNQYEISRMCVEDGQSTGSLGRWILGGYDVYRKVKKLCVR